MRKEKKYHYIYKTTNVINNKYYIGMHSTDKLNDGYIGGGKYLWNSINYHGRDYHVKEILEFVNTRENLKKREEEIVNEQLINENLCMNLKTGGQGGFSSEEHQLKCSIAGNKALNEKLKDSEFKKIFNSKVSDGVKDTYENGRKGNNYFSWKGKVMTTETKKKMSDSSKGMGKGSLNSQYGTCWVTDGKVNKKIKKIKLIEFIKEGWLNGKTTIKWELITEMKIFYDMGNSYASTSKKFNIPISTIRDNFKKCEN